MRILLHKNSYIIGFGEFVQKDFPESEEYSGQDLPEELTDKYNQPLYKWDGTKPIYSPQPYTPEQTEQLRKAEVRAEIRELYSVEDEIKILRNAVKSTETIYTKYNKDIENIITSSKTKEKHQWKT